MISCFWQSYMQTPENTLMSIVFQMLHGKRITMSTRKSFSCFAKFIGCKIFLLYNLNSYYCNAISLLPIPNGPHLVTIFLAFFYLLPMSFAEPSLLIFTIQVWPLKIPLYFCLWCLGMVHRQQILWLTQSNMVHLIFWPFLDSAPENWAPWFSYHKSFLFHFLDQTGHTEDCDKQFQLPVEADSIILPV